MKHSRLIVWGTLAALALWSFAIEPARLIHDRDHARAVKLGAVCPSCEAWEALETALEES